MCDNFSIRVARPNDISLLAFFMNQAPYVCRHLDWRPTLDWLGEDYFWILEQDRQIQGVFACPTDPPGVAWVRLFASGTQITPHDAWKLLFAHALERLKQETQIQLAAISLHNWFEHLLIQQDWLLHQKIVTLSWDGDFTAPPPMLAGTIMRPMLPEDLPEVTRVDNLAFESLWQLSDQSLKQAYEQSAFATLVELDGQIIAYQLSTATTYSAHLARLAVLPQLQGKKIGHCLVYDLLKRLERAQIGAVTVNTQHDNLASQALYTRLGFKYTGDQFPVLIYPF